MDPKSGFHFWVRCFNDPRGSRAHPVPVSPRRRHSRRPWLCRHVRPGDLRQARSARDHGPGLHQPPPRRLHERRAPRQPFPRHARRRARRLQEHARRLSARSRRLSGLSHRGRHGARQGCLRHRAGLHGEPGGAGPEGVFRRPPALGRAPVPQVPLRGGLCPCRPDGRGVRSEAGQGAAQGSLRRRGRPPAAGRLRGHPASRGLAVGYASRGPHGLPAGTPLRHRPARLGTVALPRSAARTRDRFLVVRGKGAKERLVPLTEAAQDAARAYLALWRSRRRRPAPGCSRPTARAATSPGRPSPAT